MANTVRPAIEHLAVIPSHHCRWVVDGTLTQPPCQRTTARNPPTLIAGNIIGSQSKVSPPTATDSIPYSFFASALGRSHPNQLRARLPCARHRPGRAPLIVGHVDGLNLLDSSDLDSIGLILLRRNQRYRHHNGSQHRRGQTSHPRLMLDRATYMFSHALTCTRRARSTARRRNVKREPQQRLATPLCHPHLTQIGSTTAVLPTASRIT